MQNIYDYLGINLDLAVEAHELLRGDTEREIPGVQEDKETYPNATITTITILSPEGAEIMRKPIGKYITIDAPNIGIADPDIQREISSLISKKIQELIPQKLDLSMLLIGLGNWNATPDSLGPIVIDKSVITRHLFHYAPDALAHGMRSVCGLTPGVLGITGIETAEIVRGVVEKVQPDFVVVIDALAAKNTERIGRTIQISDTGISPGSGVGNQRSGINQETLGVPVIALGCPTVVHAGIIMEEVVEKLIRELQLYPEGIHPPVIHDVIGQVLSPFGGDLTVTPKEIDGLIENISSIIAHGLNQGLHPNVAAQDFLLYQ